MTKKMKPTQARPVAIKETRLGLPKDYSRFLEGLKKEILESRIRAALAVNCELIQLYWRIGRQILQRQEKEGWGTKVVDRLSADLTATFPEMKGFSPLNLKRMRRFAEEFGVPGRFM